MLEAEWQLEGGARVTGTRRAAALVWSLSLWGSEVYQGAEQLSMFEMCVVWVRGGMVLSGVSERLWRIVSLRPVASFMISFTCTKLSSRRFIAVLCKSCGW